MWFASDNSGPAHPAILQALDRANEGYAASYGGDALTARVEARVREMFGAPEARVFLVATGGAANVLALSTLVDPWSAIFCHEVAHIEEDEGGSPEFFTGGAKLVKVAGADARMDPEALGAAMGKLIDGFLNHVEKGALSLTQVTERGTVYSAAAQAALVGHAQGAGIPVHMDGARFANAVAALGCTPAQAAAGVDALCFGATKNGCLGVEAVVLFDPARAWAFERQRKRGGHLLSKHRYLAAQFDAYLEGDMWLDLATRANARAAELARGLAQIPDVRFDHPVEANLLFFHAPRGLHRALVAAGAQYYMDPGDGPDDERLPCRMVTNWATSEDDVGRVLEVIRAG